MQIEAQVCVDEAGQLLALMQGLAQSGGEAMQNEKQAFVPEYVNQYVSGTHLPATAWPRQMLAVFYDPPPAGNSGWLYRLGCRVPTYESGVRGREPRAGRELNK